MKNSKLFWLLGLVLVLSIFLAACGGGEETDGGTESETPEETETETPEEGEATEGASGEPDAEQVLNLVESADIPTMDSALAEDAVAFNIMNNVNEGLFRLNEENVAIPALADGEPEISEDGLTYTFKLRDANWSDGTPVTANDFVFAWQKAVDPATGSPYGPYMMGGTIDNATEIAAGDLDPSELGVEATDDKTLVVTLERPTPYFMSLMAFGTFYPQNEEFVAAQGDDYAQTSDNLLYNGPFVLSNWDITQGGGWTMEKNPEYWDAETVTLETINVNVVKETATAINSYDTGDIDRAGLSAEYALQRGSDPDVVKELEPTLFYLKFNQERNGEETPLANVNIRKAISMSFNKQDLVDVVLANGSLPANYLVPTEFAFTEDGEDFREVNGDLTEFNAEQAKEFWATGLEEIGQTEVTLELLGGDSELAGKMDAYLKDQMETNLEGLTVNLKAVPFAVRLELDEAQDYDMQNSGWGPDYQDPMTFLDLFVTGSAQNGMSYSSEEYDGLIDSAKGELATDAAARWQAMADAERLLIEEDAIIAPIYQRATMSLQKPYVQNIISHPFGGDYSYKWAFISGKE